jgi:hypothetical protein
MPIINVMTELRVLLTITNDTVKYRTAVYGVDEDEQLNPGGILHANDHAETDGFNI